MLIAAIIVLLFAAEQGSRVFTDTWLGFWASNNFHQGMWFYIGIYAASGLVYSLLTFSRWGSEPLSLSYVNRSAVGSQCLGDLYQQQHGAHAKLDNLRQSPSSMPWHVVTSCGSRVIGASNATLSRPATQDTD